MKILILAPHPFYQERGTPIAVDLLIKALLERGDNVDLLTFHEGVNRTHEGLTIFRINPSSWIKGVKPGFSMKKLICDGFMFFKFIALVSKHEYNIVHAVEESAFMAMLVCPFKSLPFIYDMDSSMSTQLIDMFAVLRPFQKLLHLLESLPTRRAEVVLPVCDALAEEARKKGAKRVTVLKDVSLVNDKNGDAIRLRKDMGFSGKIVMYIGNLESYQGIDLMLQSFAVARQVNQQTDLVIIGGTHSDIEKYQNMAKSLKIDRNVHFLGKKPVEHIGAYLCQADLLLSPRIQGVNTPMKIYSYLHSGVAVLATDKPTHTQVMDKETAVLAPAEKGCFAKAMVELLNNDKLCRQLGQQASQLIEREYSYPVYKKTLFGLYDSLEASLS